MADDKKRTRAKKAEISATLAAALTKVTDYMSDLVKAKTLLSEGKAAIEKGDYLGAIDCFSHGISFNPMNTDLYKMRVNCYKTLNMLSEAYFDYSFLIRLEPSNANYYCSRSLILAKMKKYDMAVEDADYAVELNPIPLNYYSRGTIQSDRNVLDRAIDDFSRSINDPQIANEPSLKLKALHRRALAYFETSSYESCISDTAAILMIDPNHIVGRSLMARALKMIGELKKAEEQITNVITMENDQPGHFIERGDIRFRTGEKNKCIEAVYDFDSAIRILERKIQRTQEQNMKKRGVLGIRQQVNSASTSNLGGLLSSSSNLAHSASAPALQIASSSVIATTTLGLMEDDQQAKINKYTQFGTEPQLQTLLLSQTVTPTKSTPDAQAQQHQMTPLQLQPVTEESGDIGTPVPEARTTDDIRLSTSMGDQTTGAGALGDTEELLAEALFRRAQAKLMIDCFNHNTTAFIDGLMPGGHSRRPPEMALLEAALQDSLKAAALISTDDDFQLLVSNCFIRLGRWPEARRILDLIISRSPNHQRAQFHVAFCQQEEGQKRDAIESLTKIIANSSNKLSDSVPTHFYSSGKVTLSSDSPENIVSLGRLYESRGTLFHDIQVHKLALTDLGKAIAMDPLRPENFFLRGDCHSKLGNYELALVDFTTAEDQGFADLFSLFSARGVVHRLLGNSELALHDFSRASEHMDLNDKSSVVRMTTLTALCLIDIQDFEQACDLLSRALMVVRDIIDRARELTLRESMTARGAATPPTSLLSPNGVKLSARSRKGFSPSNRASTGRSSPVPSAAGKVDPASGAHGDAPPMSLTAARKLEWILLYHQALTLYNQGFHEHVEAVLRACIHPSSVLYAPDEHSVSKAQFFLSLSLSHLNKLPEAEELMKGCLASGWVISEEKRSLCWFVLGKQKQRVGHHREAVECFSKAVEFDNEHAHAYFRRAWSYKAQQKYFEAGSDFEMARSLRPEDPNFAVDYKSIGKCEYMQIDSEPDLILLFPALLPNNL